MRRTTFAGIGIGLLVLAAGCTMCAHPYDYCGPVYDGPCVSCGACGGGCGECGDVACGQGGPCEGGACASRGDCGASDDMCRPCVSRAGSVLGGGVAGGVIPAGAMIEADPAAGPNPVPPPPAPNAPGAMIGPALDGGMIFEDGPPVSY